MIPYKLQKLTYSKFRIEGTYDINRTVGMT